MATNDLTGVPQARLPSALAASGVSQPQTASSALTSTSRDPPNSLERWDLVEDAILYIRQDPKYSFAHISMVLAIVFRFFASADAIGTQIRKWREVGSKKYEWTKVIGRSNTRSLLKSHKPSQLTKSIKKAVSTAVSSDDELKKIMGKYGWHKGVHVERPLPLPVYKRQVELLYNIDNYIKGLLNPYERKKRKYVDRSEEERYDSSTTCSWQLISVRCHSIMPLIHFKASCIKDEKKRKDTRRFEVSRIKGKKKRNCTRGKLADDIQKEVESLLDSHLFTLDGSVSSNAALNPHMLPHFWDLCLAVRGIAPRLPQGGRARNNRGKRHNRAKEKRKPPMDHIPSLFERLVKMTSDELDQIKDPSGKLRSLRKILEVLPTIVTADLIDTLRIACQCTARTLASQLPPEHPTVLRAWAAYYRNWDMDYLDKNEFLSKCQEALTNAESARNTQDPIILDILGSYLAMVHYTFHDEELARKMATELWQQSWNIVANGQNPTMASPAVRALAESTKILFVLAIIGKKRQRLRGPFGREKCPQPPDDKFFNETTDRLHKTMDVLKKGDEICKMVADRFLDNLKAEFRDEVGAGGLTYCLRQKTDTQCPENSEVVDEEMSNSTTTYSFQEQTGEENVEGETDMFSTYINKDKVCDGMAHIGPLGG